MRVGLSDTEVICEFMEPLATTECTSGGKRSMLGWWRRETEWSDNLKWKPWTPATLTLDALWDVEQKLTHGEQISAYIAEVFYVTMAPDPARCDWRLIHATVAQKTEALAKAIREIKT